MFDPKQLRIGLFKEKESFTLYVNNFYWKDFQPLIIYEEDIKINTLYINSKDGRDVSLNSNTSMDIVVPYRWINEQIIEHGDYPFEFEVILNNNIKIVGNSTFFYTTFKVPPNLIIGFIHKIAPLTEQYKCEDCKPIGLINLLISHCGEILLIDKEIINFVPVVNTYQYFAQLDDEIQEYWRQEP